MAYRWQLGDFMTGQIIRVEPLPVEGNSGSVSIDIHSEDDTTINIPLGQLTQAERNDWHGTFPELRRFVVLSDDSVAWNAPGAVLFAGFINKITPRVKPHTVELQLTGLMEYTKARIVGEMWGAPVTDPTQAVTFEAGTWQGVMNAAIKRMFDNTLIPLSVPKTPSVLGAVGDSTGTGKKKSVLITAAANYHTVLTEISEADSGLGLEFRFVPRWADASMTSVVWDFITGTEAVPHINAGLPISLELSETGANFSAWDTTIDSNDLYSALYLQSKAGDEEAKSGADFTGASLPPGNFPILVERFFNPGVELTPAQLQEQLVSRLGFAGKSKYTAGFSVEMQGNPVTWLSRVGSMLNVAGVPDTISAGHDAELRCVGVSFKPGKGTVSVDVMQKQPIYPRLPRKDLSGLFGGTTKLTNTRLKPSKTTGSGGGGGTTPPKEEEEDGIDGAEFTFDDKWGSEGFAPGDIKKTATSPKVSDYQQKDYPHTNFDGRQVIDPITMTQTKRNRIYGLDSVSFAAGRDVSPAGQTTDFNGGLNHVTGEILELKPVYIKKTYFQSDGLVGPVQTVGTIPVAKLREMLPEWVTPDDYAASGRGGYYFASLLYSLWVSDTAAYVAIGSILSSASTMDYSNSWNTYSGRIVVLKSSVNADGTLKNDWTESASPSNHHFPLPHGMSRFGDVFYSSISIAWDTRKFKNIDIAAGEAMEPADLAEVGTALFSRGILRFGPHISANILPDDPNRNQSAYMTMNIATGFNSNLAMFVNYKDEAAGWNVYLGPVKMGGGYEVQYYNFSENPGRVASTTDGVTLQGHSQGRVTPLGIPYDVLWQNPPLDSYSEGTPPIWTGSVATIANGWAIVSKAQFGNEIYPAVLKKVSTFANGTMKDSDWFDLSNTDLKYLTVGGGSAEAIPGNAADYGMDVLQMVTSFDTATANPSSPTQTKTNFKMSPMFSFRGRVINFCLSAAGTLRARSIMIENN